MRKIRSHVQPIRRSHGHPVNLIALMMIGLFIGLGSGCGTRNDVQVTASDSTTKPIAPSEVAQALEALANHILTKVGSVADRMDEMPGADNRSKGRTLDWRLRTAEATLRARTRNNSVIGLFDLWFYTISMEAFVTKGAGADPALPGHDLMVATAHALRADTEKMVARVVPPKRFPALRDQMVAAAGSGELLVTSSEQEQDILGQVLDATHLESVISIALSPFDALKGIGSGGDALGQLVVAANRAIDIAEVYPQLISWQVRKATISIDQQDTMQLVRTEILRIDATLDALPDRLRSTAIDLLNQTGPAQQDARLTLTDITTAAAALERAAIATDAAVRDIQVLTHSPDATAAAATGAAAHPFDIREYTEALQAAEATAKETRATLQTASDPASRALLDDAVAHSRKIIDDAVQQSQTVLDDAVRRSQAALDRMLFLSYGLILCASLTGAGLIILHHRMKKHYAKKDG